MESTEPKLPAHRVWDGQRSAQTTVLPVGPDGIRVVLIEPYTKVGGRWLATGELLVRTEARP
jgi:hypothetical protein